MFLLATLGLSLWLGYQALDAARSHRRTAEGVLTDYAGIAVAEYSRRIQENLGRFNRYLFDDIPRTLRRRAPHPEELENDLYYAVRDQRCRCTDLQEEAWFFRVDLGDREVVTFPDALPPAMPDRLASELSQYVASRPDERTGLFLLPEGSLLDFPGVVIYKLTGFSDDRGAFAYGLVVGVTAMEELFSRWYERGSLLPPSIAGSEPNDSIIQVSVRSPAGLSLYQSSLQLPDVAIASDTLSPEFDAMVVQAAVRQDAAPRLIIGGLPRQRLPFLGGLILLTMGLGTAALLQMRKEHELARLRDDFISSVSHEFRTPLTQIQVFADLLDSGRLESEEKRRWSTGVIKREARRLSHLVANILHFSPSRQASVHSGVVEPIHLASSLEESIDTFLPQAESEQAKIRTEVDADLHVLASRPDFHRILANLLDNALKYGPDGQTIEVVATEAGNSVRISVEDEGPGIAREDRKKVFEPYFRLERERAGQVQGSGIGLALVAELSAQMDGRVWVEDTEKGGARFVVELPMVQEEAGDRHASSNLHDRSVDGSPEDDPISSGEG
jgi:signal transduction histidine kinase